MGENGDFQHCHRTKRNLKFKDGIRTVDFVLTRNLDHAEKQVRRCYFEKNVTEEGLQIEPDDFEEFFANNPFPDHHAATLDKRDESTVQTLRVESCDSKKARFTKIHVPQETLLRYCEIMRIKMKVNLSGLEKDQQSADGHLNNVNSRRVSLTGTLRKVLPKTMIDFLNLNESEGNPILYEYSRGKDYLFGGNVAMSVAPTVRTAVAHYILERTNCGDKKDDPFDTGLTKLLEEGVYLDAFPLHDGNLEPAEECKRTWLLQEWASMVHWIKLQPLTEVKDYFGTHVGMYFAWQGFYTNMLIWASSAGLLCFLFGLVTFRSNQVSQDICRDNSTIMCPQCDAICDYWKLGDTCLSSRLAYLFDNKLTIWFALFMSVWASVYLKMWKRYVSHLQHKWGVRDYDAQVEPPRPQYLARLLERNSKNTNSASMNGVDEQTVKADCAKTVLNTYTGKKEPAPRFWSTKLPSLLYSYSVILLFIGLAVAAVFGFVIYRMSLLTARHIYGDPADVANKRLMFSAVAAIIDLALSIALDVAYNAVAVRMTNIEYHRTQNDYNESLNLKVFLFQFVNYYSSIFYIAFLKGKFPGYPAKYNRILGFRQEECQPGGCLMELSVQLAIIMIGKQTVSLIRDFSIPYFVKQYREWRKRNSKEEDDSVDSNEYTEDDSLISWNERCRYDDYVKMVIQYGFITIFVVAFPLAPLFALLNNVFETRLDAMRYLKFYKRPVPKRVRDIGMWYDIMDVIAKMAVVSSAFIIAFSSTFIPRLVYMSVVNRNKTDEGFLNHTLAYFNVEHFQAGAAPLVTKFHNISMCRYQEYRNPPFGDRPYKRPLIYWHIFAFRLAFIVIYQNVVSTVQGLVNWIIPDTPSRLQEQIKQEQYYINQRIMSGERTKAKRTVRSLDSVAESDPVGNGVLTH
ncbi:anoctamin-1 [Aedes aegypti]|uniref:Anoctamin n=1 Tax=Aedes aegypti TaxID=7159 RepID=A0A6I8U6U8_AEDAE|nr:anoctamin-1 [Aedes aegypti]